MNQTNVDNKMRSCKSDVIWIAIIAIAVFILDILTKIWAVQHLKYSPSIVIISDFFRLAYGENTGIAFGMFQNHGGLLHFIAPAAFILLLIIIYKQFAETEMDGWYISIFGLLIGGAMGNILNRMYSGYVVDFIDFHNLFGYHFPTFNIADSALTIGEVILVVKLLFGAKRPEESSQDSQSEQISLSE